ERRGWRDVRTRPGGGLHHGISRPVARASQGGEFSPDQALLPPLALRDQPQYRAERRAHRRAPAPQHSVVCVSAGPARRGADDVGTHHPAPRRSVQPGDRRLSLSGLDARALPIALTPVANLITVLICTHNRAALLSRVLDSLNRAKRPAGGAEIL